MVYGEELPEEEPLLDPLEPPVEPEEPLEPLVPEEPPLGDSAPPMVPLVVPLLPDAPSVLLPRMVLAASYSLLLNEPFLSLSRLSKDGMLAANAAPENILRVKAANNFFSMKYSSISLIDRSFGQ